MKAIKVLITGCGRHSRSLVQSLKHNIDHREVSVIGINSSAVNILRSDVDSFAIAPGIHEDGYTDWLLDFCTQEKVDVILPYITAELPIAAANREKLESGGAKVSVASVYTLGIANDKLHMAKRFREYMPLQTEVRSPEEILSFARYAGYDTGTPLCCKLTDSCGGAGFAVLAEKRCFDIASFNKIGVSRYISISQLCEIAAHTDARIILQEYVPGTDYSVCVLADHGTVKLMCGFAGYSMEYGAVTSGEIMRNDRAYEIAEHVTQSLALDGNACFDFIIRKTDGQPVLLECNPRISATLPFVAEAGADLVYLRCKQLLGEPFDTDVQFRYGLKMVKYYECFFYR